MQLYIKYMVGTRCKAIVQQELTQLGLHCGTIGLGKVEVQETMLLGQYQQLRLVLLKSGLELLDTRRATLIEKIKAIIVDMVHTTEGVLKIRNSDYISSRLNHDYAYLAGLFSEVTGGTIEHYIIARRIDWVKELLLQGELSLTRISQKLNYSSVAHLSSQFKKETGLTPTLFKRLWSKKELLIESGNYVTFFCNCVRVSETMGVSFVTCK